MKVALTFALLLAAFAVLTTAAHSEDAAATAAANKLDALNGELQAMMAEYKTSLEGEGEADAAAAAATETVAAATTEAATAGAAESESEADSAQWQWVGDNLEGGAEEAVDAEAAAVAQASAENSAADEAGEGESAADELEAEVEAQVEEEALDADAADDEAEADAETEDGAAIDAEDAVSESEAEEEVAEEEAEDEADEEADEEADDSLLDEEAGEADLEDELESEIAVDEEDADEEDAEAEAEAEGQDEDEADADAEDEADADEEADEEADSEAEEADAISFVSMLEHVGKDHGIKRVRTRNVDPYLVNRRHIGMFGGEADPARLGLDGTKQLAILKQCPIFNAQGAQIGTADPQYIGGTDTSAVNAGAISTVHGEDCVLGFRLRTGQGRVTGWVPASAFDHTPEVVAYSKTVARAIDRVRPAKDQTARRVAKYHVIQRSATGPMRRWYVFPGQTGKGSRAKNFFMNTKGTVNLLLNVPTEGTTLWGETIDVLPIDTEFHRLMHVPSRWVDLFDKGAMDPLGLRHRLRFVYGYALNGAKEKRYGWINRACLLRDGQPQP